MKHRVQYIGFFLALFSFQGYAQNLLCNFSTGSEGVWEAGEVRILSTTWTEGPVTITESAQNSGGYILKHGDLSVSMSRKFTGFGPTFISEQVGSPVYVSVFDTPLPDSSSYYAVMSRHTMLTLSPLPSQYHGYCDVAL